MHHFGAFVFASVSPIPLLILDPSDSSVSDQGSACNIYQFSLFLRWFKSPIFNVIPVILPNIINWKLFDQATAYYAIFAISDDFQHLVSTQSTSKYQKDIDTGCRFCQGL